MIGGQFVESHPAVLGDGKILRFASHPIAEIGMQADQAVVIAMFDDLQRLPDSDAQSHFLTKLPDETVFERFAGLRLAAGQLPESRQDRISGPPGNEQAVSRPMAADESADGYMNDSFGHRLTRMNFSFRFLKPAG